MAAHDLVRPPIPMPTPEARPLRLGATWNPELARRVGTAFGDRHAGEVVGVQLDQTLRDPRLGRNELGYAEDPLLAARLAAAHLFGMSGACTPVITDLDEQACCGRRHGFSARALHEQELPVYRAVFEIGGAQGLVLPRHLFDDSPMVVRMLIEEGVRPWSDGRAPVLTTGGPVVPAMRAGADGFVGDGQVLDELVAAEGLDAEIVAATARMAAVFGRVGVSSGEDHGGLDLAVAREAVVLLRNDGLLPLLVGPGMRVAVVHPGGSCGLSAAVRQVVTAAGGTVTLTGGNDRVRLREADGRRCLVAVGGELRLGQPSGGNDVFDAIEWSRHVFELSNGPCRQVVDLRPANDGTVALRYVRNGQTVVLKTMLWEPVADGATLAAEAAAAADVALVVVGNDAEDRRDRENLLLPAQQERTLRAVRAANPNTVLAVLSSHPYALDWAEANIGGILWSAPGSKTDVAVTEVLFGERSPAGRLPQTWYRATDTGFDTYLYHCAEPLFPFGHGLSYTTFRYDPPVLSARQLRADGRITVTIRVHNKGFRDSDEVVQLYTRQLTSRVRQPRRQLRHFTRIAVPARTSRTVAFTLTADDVSFFDVASQDWVLETAEHEVLVGGHAVRFDTVGQEIPIRRLAGASLMCTRADEAAGMVLVDGPAMEATGQRSWLAFRGCDVTGCRTWSLDAENPTRVPLYVGLHLDDPKGPLIGVLAVPPGSGPQRTPITGEAPGIRDVFAVFTHPGLRARRLMFG
ncbi:glycoside hydrolase family 3 C-terminal domain-containing protein [Kutzneria sp. 744]|uniref:glycoside hydrolase family 3 C-terminal domain-containing protein n=1 Tax=Kutzneria sp. (strain 744) TaxID=345341 RepID=UPI0003EECF95|nr:glycoside hydrolase family 3 C-terminal domain-containing protein [Kutzneria sp. 744]EWM12256.1 beta-glucosidase [Kutzneria sp. 744]